MASACAREIELAELWEDLETVAGVIIDLRDSDRSDLPRDDLAWAIGIVGQAADFVAQTLDRIKEKEGAEQ